MIRHPVFIRKFGDKTFVGTIIDSDILKDFPKSDCFVIADTKRNIYSGGNLVMNLDTSNILDAQKYCNELGEEGTQGNGLGGVFLLPIWFCKKVKSIMDIMGG